MLGFSLTPSVAWEHGFDGFSIRCASRSCSYNYDKGTTIKLSKPYHMVECGVRRPKKAVVGPTAIAVQRSSA